MKKTICPLFLLLYVLFFSGAYSLFAQESLINELEKIITEAESKDNVNARSYIHQYWQLAGLYLEKKDNRNAYRVIIKGLTLDPWNYTYQKIAADIEAANRFNFITNNLKELALIYEDSLAQRDRMDSGGIAGQPLYLSDYYLYIAAYPDLNTDVVDFTAARIAGEYGIEVKTINVGAEVSDVNARDLQLTIYDNIIENVRNRYAHSVIAGFLKQTGLTEEELNTKKGKGIFVYHLLNQNENGMEQWKEIEMTRSQYSANALLNQLSGTFSRYLNDPHCLGILGITREDMYENDYNFLLGWAQKKLGVMSYARFTVGNPGREQFEKRVVMQAFSSAGLVIGIPRCTNPNCARAYPNSVEEHDRKEDKLCAECKTNLRKLYASLK